MKVQWRMMRTMGWLICWMIQREAHGANTLTLGHTVDLNQKDAWLPEAPEEKKDWIRIAPEPDSGGLWHEEERETGLLGRGDRRKMERRVDNASGREISDNRALPAIDRWHDVSSRILGMRQDMMANGLQDGVLMKKKRTFKMSRRKNLRVTVSCSCIVIHRKRVGQTL